MKFPKFLTALVCLPALFSGVASAQSAPDEDRASYTISMNQDTFFGFYPIFTSAYKVNDKVDWTTYGIFWTTPSFGTGGGSGLWTEFGTGVNFKAADGKVNINPQLGFLNGKLLSNGNFPMAFEGFVPNITANVNTDRAEAQLYAGFYTALRKGRVPDAAGSGLTAAPVQNNFVHWWLNGGYKIAPVLSAGLHYEALDFRASGSGSSGIPNSGVYKWLGPYVQANLSSKFSVRFTFGANVMDRPATDGNDSFYKLGATYTFP
ncbi:MAG: hypothetical protein M9913_10260 [Bryobacteraceae bacterium]|nr:hypothetical protein [Solibacteraceae bacterium]MCL4844057.1 hypothetical protein [Bryobacteraceae bacterium]MCO5351263.1 hypothetical protein [Bryobacteraceae bacterium]